MITNCWHCLSFLTCSSITDHRLLSHRCWCQDEEPAPSGGGGGGGSGGGPKIEEMFQIRKPRIIILACISEVEMTMNKDNIVIDICLEGATGIQNCMPFGWIEPNRKHDHMLRVDLGWVGVNGTLGLLKTVVAVKYDITENDLADGKGFLRNLAKFAILGENISQEDLNLKFLRSLPVEWNTHVVVWRNKPDLDTMSFDDLYNNFKIIEQEVKRTVSSSSNSSSQNVAFVSSPSSTYEVNTASIQVSTASTPVTTASLHDNTANLSDAAEMDLKWQLALLSMRARKYYQRTGKKITINGSDTTGYDKTKGNAVKVYQGLLSHRCWCQDEEPAPSGGGGSGGGGGGGGSGGGPKIEEWLLDGCFMVNVFLNCSDITEIDLMERDFSGILKRLRWTLNEEHNVIDIGLKGATGIQNYMAFGWTEPIREHDHMLRVDVAVTGFNEEK
ncbi:ribonuclease H-like domain-containing protein [Tanacetum coccineum]